MSDKATKFNGYSTPKWYQRAKLTHIITMTLAWFFIGFILGMVVLSL